MDKKITSSIINLAKAAKTSFYRLNNLGEDKKASLLKKMAHYLIKEKRSIILANKKDISQAKRHKLKKSFIDRLALNEQRIKQMSVSLEEIAALPSPVGEVIKGYRRPNGLFINKVRVPVGVVLIVYEARPNVTSDCIGLCFKSSNVAVLRGGSAALRSNVAIYKTLLEAVKSAGIDFAPFFMVDLPQHETVDILLKQSGYIDLVIPRGGEQLIKKVAAKSKIPVIKHYKGVCHLYIDEFADLAKAVKISVNAKVQRPSVCNAVETILVHRKVASDFLKPLKREFDKYSVVVKGCKETVSILEGIEKAKNSDWATEYLDLAVSIKVVGSIEEAVSHINIYGSHHTDSIISENYERIQKFMREVDSACCFANISTRFSDGYQFGLGAEIGISTDKIGARGPMGLEELTTYKWVVYGNGQVRS